MGVAAKLKMATLWLVAASAFVMHQPLTCRRSHHTPRSRIVMMPQGVPQVPYQPKGADYWIWTDIYQRLYRERILLVGNFLDEDAANQLIAILLYLKYDNPVAEISIYFNVPGALMKPSLAIFDTITSLNCPVSTVNLGLATGMGAFLCGAGTKGKRYALPNARFLMQRTGLDDPYRGQASDIGLIVQENLRDNDRTEKALARMTGQSIQKINADMDRDFYLSAEEAVEYGLIDEVLYPSKKADDEPFDSLSMLYDEAPVGFEGTASKPRTGTPPPPPPF